MHKVAKSLIVLSVVLVIASASYAVVASSKKKRASGLATLASEALPAAVRASSGRAEDVYW